jgi:opacity protein-like surface antigen
MAAGSWDAGLRTVRSCSSGMKRTFLAVTVLAALAAVAAASAQKPPKAPKQPRTLSLSATPNPVKFGRSVTLSGTLVGPGSGGKTVKLREDPFPFDDSTTVATASTDAQGGVSFLRSPAVNTNFQLRQGGVESAVVTVSVSPRVSLRFGDRTPAAGTRVRFSGRICPQHDGASLEIQRRTAQKQWRTVRRVVTKDAGEECSSYARRLRVRRDRVFRTFFAGDNDHAAGSSRARRIDVH